jgi:hypothetical protein
VSVVSRAPLPLKITSDFLPRLNFTVTYKHILNDNAESMTRGTTGLLEFNFGKSDIITGIGQQKHFTEIGVPSQEVEWYQYIWYVPCAKPIDRIEKIATIFSVSLWITLTAMFIATGIITWQLARLTRQDDNYKDISIVFYSAWAIVVGVVVTKMPRIYHLRIVIFLGSVTVFLSALFSRLFSQVFLLILAFTNRSPIFMIFLSPG